MSDAMLLTTAAAEENALRYTALLRLLEVTRVLAEEVDTDRIMPQAIRGACRALDCERASLYAYDPQTNELYTTATVGLEINEIRTTLGRGISGATAESRRAEIIADPPSDPRWSPRIDKATGFKTRNILSAPVIAPDDRLLGVLQLINKRSGAFDDFDLQLALAFASHTAAALDRAALVEQRRERQRIESALHAAREIQQAFMPTELKTPPGYEAATWWLPNQAIGGDYCDLITLRDGRLGMIVADVSGHGLGPSLLMASVRAALRALVLMQSSPETILSMLGKTLYHDLSRGLFITMILGTIDVGQHLLHFANAGHGPALHYSAKRNRFRDLDATGMPLGIEDQPEYTTGPTIRLDVGDVVLFCTDGIVEAADAKGKQFGAKRLKNTIRQHLDLPLDLLVQRIGAEVKSHYAGDAPADDLTILAVRRTA
jgi:sigma-B regulation protein RsbU (phosphoserine phosphatase)